MKSKMVAATYILSVFTVTALVSFAFIHTFLKPSIQTVGYIMLTLLVIANVIFCIFTIGLHRKIKPLIIIFTGISLSLILTNSNLPLLANHLVMRDARMQYISGETEYCNTLASYGARNFGDVYYFAVASGAEGRQRGVMWCQNENPPPGFLGNRYAYTHIEGSWYTFEGDLRLDFTG